MTIETLYHIPFANHVVIAATLAGPDKLVMLLSSGDVVKYSISNQNMVHLFSIKSSFTYPDGGFDINAESTIYTLDDIVVVVNNLKRHGYIHYPGKYYGLHLHRGEYYADSTYYPIALFKNKEDIPHIIYGVDWNHVQVMNLNTRQVLTAAKSLIEEGAEERHIEFYKMHKEDNKLAWPRPYDYFYGKLQTSPNGAKFLSNGWAWGSYDAYCVYEIDHFITSNRIKDIHLGSWEHDGRGACWVDDDTVVVACNPYADEMEDATPGDPDELHFYTITGQTAALTKKIAVKLAKIYQSTLHYYKQLNCFVAFSFKTGVTVINPEGEILYRDSSMMINEFNAQTGLLTKVDVNAITVYQVK